MNSYLQNSLSRQQFSNSLFYCFLNLLLLSYEWLVLLLFELQIHKVPYLFWPQRKPVSTWLLPPVSIWPPIEKLNDWKLMKLIHSDAPVELMWHIPKEPNHFCSWLSQTSIHTHYSQYQFFGTMTVWRFESTSFLTIYTSWYRH